MNDNVIGVGDRTIRNALFAALQTIILGVLVFAVYGFAVRRLGAADIGLWAVLLAGASVSRISELGFTAGAVKLVAGSHARREFERASQIIETAVITTGVVLGGLLLLLWPIANIIVEAFFQQQQQSALSLVPYALMSVWMSNIAGVLSSSLDGCQRADLRAIVMVGSGLVFGTLIYLLIPRFGLTGFAAAQIGQSCTVAVGSWLLLRWRLPTLSYFPLGWRRASFRELLRYGVRFQVGNAAALLYEPLTKAYLTSFGGLSATGYYEMASRMVLQFRGLIVAANEVVVPRVAALHATTPERVSQASQASFRTAWFLTLPVFTSVISALPLISVLWIGQLREQFIIFGALLVCGYAFNTVTAPAYFVNLGTGRLRWNIISHLLTAFANLFLGFLLGTLWGATGVVVGAMGALIAGSALVVLEHHRERKVNILSELKAEGLGLFVTAGGIVCAVGLLWAIVKSGAAGEEILLYVPVASVTLLIIASCVHPRRAILCTALARQIGSIERWRGRRAEQSGRLPRSPSP